MSSFLRNTLNPKTNKYEPAAWIDDYFGNHHYGVMWLNGTMTDPERIKLKTNQDPVQVSWDAFSTKINHTVTDLRLDNPEATTTATNTSQSVATQLEDLCNSNEGILHCCGQNGTEPEIAKQKLLALISTILTEVIGEDLVSHSMPQGMPQTTYEREYHYNMLRDRQRATATRLLGKI